MSKLRCLLLPTLVASLLACGGQSGSSSDAANTIDATTSVDASNLPPTEASAGELERYVKLFSQTHVPRDYTQVETLDKIASFVSSELTKFGYTPEEQTFVVDGETYRNVRALIGPEGGKRVIVGAHYDAAGELPGADDNASGVAGLLELARLLQSVENLSVQIELVAYSLEEPPYFASTNMGSAKHAASVDADKVQFMIALEMIGYYSDVAGSQSFPTIPGIPEQALISKYGDTGNFIALVGRPSDQAYLGRFETEMNEASPLKVETLAVPPGVQGVDWSDHRSYWDHNIPAFMVTDTAMFRNTAYHTPTDTWDRLDYSRMAMVVNGLRDGLVSIGTAPL